MVVANDQQTIVIGGLIRDVENEGTTKVPLLGDIPVIGILFRRNNTTVTKQNLVLMLTPYVIESSDDLRRITEQKRKARRKFLELFGREDKQYIANINYEHKKGVLESINQRVRKAQEDSEARLEAYGGNAPTDPDAPRKAQGDDPSQPRATPPTTGEDIIVIPEGGGDPNQPRATPPAGGQ